MFTYISYFIGITLIGSFFYLENHKIVKNKLIVNWRRFKKVNKLVSTNYKGFFTVLYISFSMILKAMWINFLQYINNNVKKIDKNTYEITYTIKGHEYKIIVKPKRGPKKTLLVSDENQEDISYLIFPYLGPKENFHSTEFTPEFFNRKELIFQLSDGSEKVFTTNQTISI